MDSDTIEDLEGVDTDMTEVPQAAPAFVDLHGQTNQPITKSRLLMACYQQHMTQLGCKRWDSPPSLQQLLKVAVMVAENWLKYVVKFTLMCLFIF